MKKKIVVLGLVGIMAFGLTGCIDHEYIQDSKTEEAVTQSNQTNQRLEWAQVDGITDARYNIYGKEQMLTEVNQTNLIKSQPAPFIKWSLERENISKRITSFNNPNKISYIYLMTNSGQVVGFFDVKGKVSSINSTLTSSDMLVYAQGVSGTVESPQMDGSYGTNGDAIFWFDSSDVYHEWNGVYFMSDQPVKLNVQPIMVEQQK